MASTTTTRGSKTATRATDDRGARATAREMVRTIADATEDLDDRLSSAAEVAGDGMRGTSEALRRRSDATLAMLGTFSLGLTTGLLFGGAHRLMVVASLVPAALVGGVILERVDGPRRSSGRKAAGARKRP